MVDIFEEKFLLPASTSSPNGEILPNGHIAWMVASGLESATILSTATNSKLIWSMYIHQSSRPTAELRWNSLH